MSHLLCTPGRQLDVRVAEVGVGVELELAVLRPPLPHALVLQVVYVLRAGPGECYLSPRRGGLR